jgi:hypothetical protein
MIDQDCGIFLPFVLLGATFTPEIEARISVAKAGFNKKKAHLHTVIT